MPDSTAFDRTRGTPPLDWGDAFDRLPLQAPAASAWPALATRVAVRTRRKHLRRRWALAASVAAVLLAPVLAWRAMQGPVEDAAIASNATRVPAPVIADTRTARAASASASMPAPDGAPFDLVRQPSDMSVVHADRVASTPSRTEAVRRAREADVDPRPANRAAVSVARQSATPPAARGTGDADAARLAGLQAESAQLEHLLRATGQDTAAAAPSIVLASALADEVQRIDGALADPALDTATRAALWDSRVQALREVAAVETAQRWRNAQGLSMDTALVRVD